MEDDGLSGDRGRALARTALPVSSVRLVDARRAEAFSRLGVETVGDLLRHYPHRYLDLSATPDLGTVPAEIVQTGGIASGSSLTDTVSQLFESVRMGSAKYPMFLNVHAVTFAHMDKKDKGRKAMNRFFGRIEALLRQSLDGDHSVRSDAFGEGFTKPAFISFVFSNILALIMDGQTTCDFLLAMIKRAICV